MWKFAYTFVWLMGHFDLDNILILIMVPVLRASMWCFLISDSEPP